MAEMVLMPQKGVSDESAVLAQWLVVNPLTNANPPLTALS